MAFTLHLTTLFSHNATAGRQSVHVLIIRLNDVYVETTACSQTHAGFSVGARFLCSTAQEFMNEMETWVVASSCEVIKRSVHRSSLLLVSKYYIPIHTLKQKSSTFPQQTTNTWCHYQQRNTTNLRDYLKKRQALHLEALYTQIHTLKDLCSSKFSKVK